MTDIECVSDARAQLGEGTYWDPATEALWWIDIYQKAIHRFDPLTRKTETHIAPELLGCLAVRASGGLILTMASGFYFFDPTTGRFDKITDPEADLPDNRFNDGKTDRQGRFWSGSMFEAPGKPVVKNASLYRMDADLSVHRIVDGIGCSNGLAWSPDSRTMYYTDSHGPVVWAWDLTRRPARSKTGGPSSISLRRRGSSMAPRSTPRAATGRRSRSRARCCASIPPAS